MLEKQKSSVDKGRVFSALLTDLSRAFDYFDHELLIAKLSTYGFSLPALRLIHDYSSKRKKRSRIETCIVVGFKLYLEYLKGRY